MKKFNLLTALAVILLLTSCGDKNTIYVWNMKDLISLWGKGILITIVALVVFCAWILDKIDEWKRKRK